MRSRTSSCHKTVFQDILRRFWPVWVLYTLILFFISPYPMFNCSSRLPLKLAYMAQQYPIRTLFGSGLMLSFAAAGILVMTIYGFLYHRRQSELYASLPVTRTGVYWSVFLAGLTGLLAGDVLVFLLVILAQLKLGGIVLSVALQWLFIIVVMNITFYGFAVFCGMLTGNVYVMPLIYLLLSIAGEGFGVLFHETARQLIYGLSSVSGTDFLPYCSPVTRLALMGPGGLYFDAQYETVLPDMLIPWRWLIIYGVSGLVFAVLGWILYKKRAMETVSETVCFRILKPLFRLCMAVGMALGFVSFAPVFRQTTYPTLQPSLLSVLIIALCGGLLGYVLAEMIIQKNFRIFSRKTLARAGILSAVILLILATVRLDLFGVEKRIPDEGSVQRVMLDTGSMQTPSYGSFEDGYGMNSSMDTEWIAGCASLHRQIVGHSDIYRSSENLQNYVSIRYALKNGRIFSREYYIDPETPEGAADNAAILELLNSSGYQAERQEKIASFARKPDCQYQILQTVNNNSQPAYGLTAEQMQDLLENCILPDLAESDMSRFFLDNQEFNQSISNIDFVVTTAMEANGYQEYLTIQIPLNAQRTLQWIQWNLGLSPQALSEIYPD